MPVMHTVRAPPIRVHDIRFVKPAQIRDDDVVIPDLRKVRHQRERFDILLVAAQRVLKDPTITRTEKKATAAHLRTLRERQYDAPSGRIVLVKRPVR